MMMEMRSQCRDKYRDKCRDICTKWLEVSPHMHKEKLLSLPLCQDSLDITLLESKGF